MLFSQGFRGFIFDSNFNSELSLSESVSGSEYAGIVHNLKVPWEVSTN